MNIKTIMMTLALSVFSFGAYAKHEKENGEGRPATSANLAMMLICNPVKETNVIIQQMQGERAMLHGAGQLMLIGGMPAPGGLAVSPIKGRLVVYYNPESKSFSIILEPTPATACLIASGGEMVPLEGHSEERRKYEEEKKEGGHDPS